MSQYIPGNNLQVEIAGNNVDLKPVKEKKPVKRRAQKEYTSPYETTETTPYYGSKPILVTWKDWVLMCKLIRESDQFKKQYAKENFKPTDLEDSGFIYPVYTKEPQEIKNLEGTVIEVLPGIYDEERTLVLPPKFTFAIYRRYFLSHPDLQRYLNEETGATAKIINFKKYDFITTSAPRGEQVELAELAKASLQQQKYFKGIVQCPPGWGKAEINSTLIPTIEGFIQMGNIEVGMKVFDRYGKPTNVIGVFPQGKIPVWEVSFEDGTTTKCNSEHLWAINYGAILDEFGEIMTHSKKPFYTKTTSDLKTLLDDGYLIEIPLCKSLSLEARRKLGVIEDTKQNCRALGYFVDEKDGCINVNRNHKRIIKIENLGYEEEQTCIMVDNGEHLYLSENFTVTHNTFISINIGSEVKGQVLIVVPNKLLKDQWIQAILEFTNLEEDDIGFLQGSDLDKLTRQNKNKRPVLIALIQSLDSQLQRNTLDDLTSFYHNVSAVFYDETHTSGAADGYAKTTGMFTTYNIIGLSATPYKKDKNLFQLYTGIGPIVYVSTHQNLIPACNMHLLPVPIAPKKQAKLYDTFQKTNYNFFMSELENFLFEVDAYFVYLAEWLIYRHKQGHSCVVLFKTNKMLEKLERFIKERLNGLDLSIVILTNETAKHNKQKLSKANIILSNFKMFSAGADVPHLSCVFFASMIMGKIPIIQTLGRITRKYSDKIQEVQAHFLLVKFIYPLFSNREPHITIADAVKTQYPSAQFKWDNEFIKYFEEKKNASKNLNANSFQQFQQAQQGNIPVNPNQRGDYLVDATYTSGNRLDVYRQQHIQNHYQQPNVQAGQVNQNGADQFQRPANIIPGMGY